MRKGIDVETIMSIIKEYNTLAKPISQLENYKEGEE